MTPPVIPGDEKPYCINLRVPPILATRMKAAAEKRRGEELKFSLNDWIIEAIRRKLDGPPLVKAATLPAPPPRQPVEDATPRERRAIPPPTASRPPNPNAPPVGTFDWVAKFNHWANRDQAGVMERGEFLTEAGVPLDIQMRSPDKILTWCKYNLPDGPKGRYEEAQEDESGW